MQCLMTVRLGRWLRRWVPGLLLAAAAAAGTAAAQCNFDVDNNGQVDAMTDGILIVRAGFGLTGQALVQGALGANANRTDPQQILDYINANKLIRYDVDGNGSFGALTDGLMILRHLSGQWGPAVTGGAIGAGPVRGDSSLIGSWLLNDCSTTLPFTAADAARFLTQVTWGPKHAEITALAAAPAPQVDNWITAQIALPRSNHLDWIIARAALGNVSPSDTYDSFWTQALTGADQLRQRVAYALSQIIVVSDQKDSLVNIPWAIASYYDVLGRNAFGNFRTLLEEVTKNPGMAIYLDAMCNDKESGTRLPNENYAREILQLFSIGTVWLNQDGTPMLDAQGNPIPTYDQNVIQGFAKVFTGWSYNGPNWCGYPQTNAGWSDPAIAFNSHHSISAKTLLALTPNGANTVLAAQAVANAQTDLTAGLDNIFNHPNVGPYIGRQLIKFLVTSNPSPGYVSRVAAKFADNGSGVRGDMQAVVRAILNDVEARDAKLAQQPSYGKLREPVQRFGNLMRSFNASAVSGRIHFYSLGDPLYGVNEQPLSSPTVFNFYSFDYAPQGAVGTHGLIGPEFEITTSTTIVTTANNMMGAITNGWGSGNDSMKIDYASLVAVTTVPAQIADYLNLVMANGAMTQTTWNQIVAAITPIGTTTDRWKVAILILFNSPEFVIQR